MLFPNPRGTLLRQIGVEQIDDKIAQHDADGRVYAAYRQVLRALPRRLELHPPAQSTMKPCRIFISGFLYSGSGALLDWLLDHGGYAKWSPVGEVRLIHGAGGVQHLAEKFAAGEQKQAAIDFYLHLVGRKVVRDDLERRRSWDIVNKQNQKMIGKSSHGYYHACFTLLNRVVSEKADIVQTLRTGLDYVFGQAQADVAGGCLLIDQAINARRLDLCQYITPSRFLVSERDPRDQFCDAREMEIRQKRPVRTAESFARWLLKQHAKYVEARPREQKAGHEFIHVRFEDFVLETSLRDGIADRLGITNRPEPRRFQPAESKLNIGIQRDLLSPRDRRTLDASLAHMYHDAAG